MAISASTTARPARPQLGPLALIHRTFWVPTAALNLAVLRIAVFSTLAVVTLQSHAVQFARLPDDLLRAPPQLGSLLVALPRSAGLVTLTLWLLVAACVAAAIGWRARWTAPAAAVLSLYVLGIPQLYGKVDHYHHLVWLAVLLACSPCADQLALDARHRDTPPPSARYGFPLRIAWLLIGFCYFFPGLAKLGEGRIWLSAANLRGLLDLQQWAAHGGLAVPAWALVPLAVGTLVFEIGFVFAVFNRRLRPWFLVAGLLFHFGTFATMNILFWNLWILYVAFIDWSRFAAPIPPADTRAPMRRTKAASAVLVAGVVLTGLTSSVSAWPFASYPTFAGSFAGARPRVDHGGRGHGRWSRATWRGSSTGCPRRGGSRSSPTRWSTRTRWPSSACRRFPTPTRSRCGAWSNRPRRGRAVTR